MRFTVYVNGQTRYDGDDLAESLKVCKALARAQIDYKWRADGKAILHGLVVDLGDGWTAFHIGDSWLVRWPVLDGWPKCELGIHVNYLDMALEVKQVLSATLNQGEINGREESAQCR